MTDRPLQVAMREVQGFFRTPAMWISTVAAGLLLGLAGPFGTEDVMRLLPRMGYWSIIAVVTFLTGTVLDAVLRPPLQDRVTIWGAVPLVSLMTSVAITGQILGLNALVFGFVPDLRGTLILFGNVFTASLVISVALTLIGMQQAPPSDAATSDAQPRLLARLPLAKRGDIIALSAVDHYVDVMTTQGTETLLIRLSDAIAETLPVDGLQVHRSHWVALAHVRRVDKGAGKAVLTLSNDAQIPVSRANLPRLKEAGLLPT